MAAPMMPPTTHVLPHAQRLRLMRSTRKLGALLGETPLLVDSSPAAANSFSPAHGRSASTMSTGTKSSGRLYLSAPHSPSLCLGESHDDSCAAHISRPRLLLHLPSSGRSSPVPTERGSPLSATFSLSLNSPVTPTFSVDTDRRRKMAKVMRTLGENVPPELVFPASASAPAPQPKARRRASTLSVPESMRERADSAASHPSLVESLSYPSAPFRASSDTLASADTRPSVSSQEPLLPPRSQTPHVDGHEDGMHRTHRDWSGEWGGKVANMEDVVRGLRELKMK
ncbi:hypothetical protein DFH08DRAFT_884417 [Mycena albidolilacea]|uniref:Uncharacterized protein n=1 Tax=Mycena albidolilacea TaxID=1033008 RepID=A0AAD6ZL94_9AGAR|nr:hypothetical protein DFH08DRAFT_884417 [Mycena albidolilacea]